MLAILVQDAAPHPERAQISSTALAVRFLTDWRDVDRTKVETGDSQLTYGDLSVLWSTMNVPCPNDLALTCAHSRLWPPTAPPPVEHTRHTLVTTSPADGGRDRAELLTKAVASMVALDPSIRAVVWAPADHVTLPAAFREVAVDGQPAALMHAWVAFNVGNHPDGHLTGHTRGLGDLGLMDIEIQSTRRSAADTLEQLRGLAHYQLTEGRVIADGDTVGADARERIQVHHVPSAFDPSVTVLQIEPAAGGRKRGLFRRG
ncbi:MULTISPECIES: DUF4261 domain-containing protein [unclassified Nocardioides]|uniref:DUF4261 domain-containing protein n=1 Tax=unclassified Nocardioides TaxID=2615069 RepID=UPI00070275E4|nr:MULTISPECIES: DUF4261 domain-containing protein [unclassified Nocardioides]KRC53569.1 hypothetical protein ASE19_14690 [Nocardioides sp. Root79]KRC67955.1 hypothetical protein ASE20_18065 [Nocardioides sp. Root240]